MRLRYIFTLLLIGLAPHIGVHAQQLRWGVKGSFTLNTLSMDLPSTKHYAIGFNAGPTLTYTPSVLPLQVEAALLYSDRAVELNQASDTERGFIRTHYISLPIDLKYNIPLDRFINLYVAGGPSLDFSLKTKLEGNVPQFNGLEIQTKRLALGVQLATGVEFFNKYRVSIAYHSQLTDALTYHLGNQEQKGARYSGFAITGSIAF